MVREAPDSSASVCSSNLGGLGSTLSSRRHGVACVEPRATHSIQAHRLELRRIRRRPRHGMPGHAHAPDHGAGREAIQHDRACRPAGALDRRDVTEIGIADGRHLDDRDVRDDVLQIQDCVRRIGAAPRDLERASRERLAEVFAGQQRADQRDLDLAPFRWCPRYREGGPANDRVAACLRRSSSLPSEAMVPIGWPMSTSCLISASRRMSAIE